MTLLLTVWVGQRNRGAWCGELLGPNTAGAARRPAALLRWGMATVHLLHHIGVFASDFTASERFYTAALNELNVQAEYRTDSTAEYWVPGDDVPSLSLETARSASLATHGLHLAFEAGDRATVDAFFRQAVAAGGRPRHEPRHWPQYRAYAAFVSDPDGNNVEALVKEAD